MGYGYRIGVDENGLGARLGPLVVTAVLARVDQARGTILRERLPKQIARDLDDSKRLVSHADVRLAEAWARVLMGDAVQSPRELFAQLSFEGEAKLRAPCPQGVEAQCWSSDGERFCAAEPLLRRVSEHRQALATDGVDILRVQSSVICTKRLNQGREQGHSRFRMDLHAMEELVLALRAEAGVDVYAVCGKVGGMGDYAKFFGPLSGRLHVVLDQGPARSAYAFPGLGQLHFVRDADAQDPLVMLASLAGKYTRELLMARIARHYAPASDAAAAPSGYHDPRTAGFVESTALLRRRHGVPDGCFERARNSGE